MYTRETDIKNFGTGLIARVRLDVNEQGEGEIFIRTKPDGKSWSDWVSLTGERLSKIELIAFAQFATRLIGIDIEFAVADYLSRFPA